MRFQLTRRTEPLTERQELIGTLVAAIGNLAMLLPVLYVIVSHLTI